MEPYTETSKSYLKRAADDIDNLAYIMRLARHGREDEEIYYIQRMQDIIKKIVESLDKVEMEK